MAFNQALLRSLETGKTINIERLEDDIKAKAVLSKAEKVLLYQDNQ